MRVIKLIFFYILNNMDNIIEPNESFDFTQLSLAHPTGIQGGAYFTKIENKKKPLYIQTCKGQTRQGFVKSGKKYYCDLMFDKNSESLINWFEQLEERCQKLIYERRDTWFQNSLEENDIESAFSSTIRVYKSGKYYLLRTNVKNNHNNVPSIKIYNEKENSMTMDDINSETNIISILEIQGIKFTSRNFQIDIELKQMMVLDDEAIFDNCLINKTRKNNNHLEKTNKQELDDKSLKNINTLNEQEIKIDEQEIKIDKQEIDEQEIEIDNILEDNTLEEINNDKDFDIEVKNGDDELNLEIEDLNDNIEENVEELKDLSLDDLPLENNLETIQLKKPNQVYFELYKEARKKAKDAKKNAILAYLEAKNIKKTYMLENIDDSDNEFDAEIDEVSESELDCF
jgi:hypothetical protein